MSYPLPSSHPWTDKNESIRTKPLYPIYLSARKRDTSSRDGKRAIAGPFFRYAASPRLAPRPAPSPGLLALSTGENRAVNHHLRRLQHNGQAPTQTLSTGLQPGCETLRFETDLPREQKEGQIGHGRAEQLRARCVTQLSGPLRSGRVRDVRTSVIPIRTGSVLPWTCG